MKEYTVKYKLGGYGYITVFANNEDDARNEIEQIFCGEEPIHDANNWIDSDVLWDIEYSTTETIDATPC